MDPEVDVGLRGGAYTNHAMRCPNMTLNWSLVAQAREGQRFKVCDNDIQVQVPVHVPV